MQKEIEKHGSVVLVEINHEKDDPYESEAFKCVDYISYWKYLWDH